MRWLAALLLLCACTPEPLASVNVRVNQHPFVWGEYVCAEFVDDKYHALLDAGIPASDMAVVYGWTPDNKQHVELEVRYKGDTYVLDNRHDFALGDPNISVVARIDPESELWAKVLSRPAEQ